MVNFNPGWNSGNRNEGKASELEITNMTFTMNSKLEEQANLPAELAQFSENIRDGVVTVTAGVHQLEEYKNRFWVHYNVRDNKQRLTFHLYLKTLSISVDDLSYNVTVISFDSLSKGVVWRYMCED